MKNIIKTLLILSVFSFSLSCTKVIDVDVPNGGERLIVEASIEWQKGSDGKTQTIRLNKSTNYFDANKINPATAAIVTVTNTSTNETFLFTEQENGVYVCNNFKPTLYDTYNLKIDYENEIIESTSVLTPVSIIKNVYQEIESGFGEEQISVVAEADDPAGIKNFYFLKFFLNQETNPAGRSTSSDELSDGNTLSEDFESDGLKAGDEIRINLQGITEAYFYYLELLITQSEGSDGPFQSIPAKLIGNCINTTNSNIEVLGYFNLSETDDYIYTVK